MSKGVTLYPLDDSSDPKQKASQKATHHFLISNNGEFDLDITINRSCVCTCASDLKSVCRDERVHDPSRKRT